ncbi:Flagellar motor switch protein FliN [Alkalibacterium sp. AK22]|uniref:flagellar motor switch phosphatase FliY n=1 Tax=Alkalibacterium sp. AK22 TaxID=1229520 RepID=UPI00045324B5|nr:flagellar motor switch phosphatase FliY [Alkalibacterium sp. AK22]EXJ22368.1 Flagellar motor switch protein FliN [Alkalibacterium sp. AK22]
MSDQLTQEQIDAMLNGGTDDASEAESPTDKLSQDVKDIIGEVGNISMSQAATTLSQLLNREVKITTPKVRGLTISEIVSASEVPKVVTKIDFKQGLVGSNILMIKMEDANVIADLMMGNDGKDVSDKPFTELELSAVSEAMNQMIGSASTAMATMFSRRVDISPPDVKEWHNPDEAAIDMPNQDELVATIAFNMSVDGLIDSEIMQVLPLDTAMEIADIMVGDEAEVVYGREGVHVQLAEEPEAQAAEPAVEKKAEEQPAVSADTVSVQKPKFQDLTPNNDKHAPRNLDLIMDVPLDFSVVLGKSRKTIKDILSLSTGSVVELDKMTDEPLEIYVNGKLIAEGEVVVINESFGIRITNILSKEQRVRHLNKD